MSDVHIAGTGIWFPEDIITNDEIVSSFNSYVDNFNNHNKNELRKEILKQWNIHHLRSLKKHQVSKLGM